MKLGPLEPHFWIAMHRYFCVSEDYGKLLKSAGEPSFTPKKKKINWGQKLSNFQTIRWLSRTSDIEIEILRVSADQERFISIALLIYVHSHIIHWSFYSPSIQWIGVREMLQESPMIQSWENRWCPVKIFPTKPIREGSWDDGHIPIWPWCPFAPSNPLMVGRKKNRHKNVE